MFPVQVWIRTGSVEEHQAAQVLQELHDSVFLEIIGNILFPLRRHLHRSVYSRCCYDTHTARAACNYVTGCAHVT